MVHKPEMYRLLDFNMREVNDYKEANGEIIESKISESDANRYKHDVYAGKINAAEQIVFDKRLMVCYPLPARLDTTDWYDNYIRYLCKKYTSVYSQVDVDAYDNTTAFANYMYAGLIPILVPPTWAMASDLKVLKDLRSRIKRGDVTYFEVKPVSIYGRDINQATPWLDVWVSILWACEVLGKQPYEIKIKDVINYLRTT